MINEDLHFTTAQHPADTGSHDKRTETTLSIPHTTTLNRRGFRNHRVMTRRNYVHAITAPGGLRQSHNAEYTFILCPGSTKFLHAQAANSAAGFASGSARR